MGKRSSFGRRSQDDYPTIDPQAVKPMVGIWKAEGIARYYEPCAGAGHLIALLNVVGIRCGGLSEFDDRHGYVLSVDARYLPAHFAIGCSAFISNPPWTRSILHAIIDRLSRLLPTWLLFDADWKHTKQAAPYLDRCSDIVSVGRLRWIPNSPHTGKDNCAWYRFDAKHTGGPRFRGQQVGA